MSTPEFVIFLTLPAHNLKVRQGVTSNARRFTQDLTGICACGWQRCSRSQRAIEADWRSHVHDEWLKARAADPPPKPAANFQQRLRDERQRAHEQMKARIWLSAAEQLAPPLEDDQQ